MKQTQPNGAMFDQDRVYRYALWRSAGFYTRTVGVIGLNPSTADEHTDDPTIRKCRHFCIRWECDRLVMLNLFAFRATDPQELLTAADPVGPNNDLLMSAWLDWCDLIVCCWGASIKSELLLPRVRALREMLGSQQVMCLGTTQSGAPKHPLYLPYETKLEPFTWPAEVG